MNIENGYPTKTPTSNYNKKSSIVKAWEKFDRVLNTINQSFIAIVTFYTIWLAFTYDKLGYFELHVAFTTLGYQFLMAETILSLSDENLWSSSFSKNTRKHIHWVMGTLGCGLAIAGTALIICDRKRHFRSDHGRLGLAAVIFIIPSVVNGPITLFSQYFNRRVKPVYMKMYHTLTASTAFCLGVGCLCTGFKKNWFKKQTSPEFVVCFIVFSSLTIILTMKTPIINTIKSIMGLIRK